MEIDKVNTRIIINHYQHHYCCSCWRTVWPCDSFCEGNPFDTCIANARPAQPWIWFGFIRDLQHSSTHVVGERGARGGRW